MSIPKPALVQAEPGRPVTAQAWNAIIGAVDALYDALNALGGNAVMVTVTAGGQPRPDARVVAVPAGGGRAIPAIAPFPGQTAHQLAGLTDGTWSLKISAAGCADVSVDVAVPAATTASVALTVTQKTMPDLFGRSVLQALSTLAAAGLTLDNILDTSGETVPKANPPTRFQTAVVLVQQPPPGALVPAGNAQVRLVVSAELETPNVTVPNLTGLTQSEAAAALAKVGLKLGTTLVKKDN
ncbi:PASTA domain-containing protein [Roseateles sp. P5_E7]